MNFEDSAGNSLYAVSGSGYVGGTQDDITPLVPGNDGTDSEYESSDAGQDESEEEGSAGGKKSGIDAKKLITIKFNGKDVTNKTQSVDPGQQIELTATVAPPLDLVAPVWTPPTSGGPIADWDQGTLTQLTSDNCDSTNITFYLTIPASGCTITYGGLDNGGVSWTAQTTFNVNPKPNVTFVADTTQFNSDIPDGSGDVSNTIAPLLAYYDSGDWSVSIGNVGTQQYGIHWNGSYFNQPGNFVICQLLSWYGAWQVGTGRLSPNIPFGSQPQCDSGFPYPDATDTPEASFGSKKRMGLNFEATDYLMWLSNEPGSIYVPVACLSWGCHITNESFGRKTDIINISGGGNTENISSTEYGISTEPTWSETFSP